MDWSFSQRLVSSPALYLPSWKEQYNVDHPNTLDGGVNIAAQTWRSGLEARIKRSLSRLAPRISSYMHVSGKMDGSSMGLF